MPTRNISLTKQQDDFVDEVVRSGEYQNASEAVRDGLRALQQRRREDAVRLKGLKAAIKEGVDALERGDYEDFDEAGLRSFFSELSEAPQKRRR